MKRLESASGLMAALMTGQASAHEMPTAAPADVGMSAEGLARLKASFSSLVDEGRRAGVVYVVARRGKVVAYEALGLRNIEARLPMTKDTVFRLYSMSRAITAASTLTLVEEGRLTLDDPVSRYIPEVAKTPVIKTIKDGVITETEPQARPMTVRDLFTYTSGLGYDFDFPKSVGFRQDQVVDLRSDIASGMRALAAYPLLGQPGAKWHYGFSGDMLGRVTEVASGQPLGPFLKARMFDKVGMPNTGFWVGADQKDKLAANYVATAQDRTLKAADPAYVLSTYDHPGTYYSAGGGLVGTAMDYLRFCQMLLNGGEIDGVRVLRPETVKMMLSRQTTPEQGLVFGYLPDQGANAGYAWGLSIGVRVADAPHAVPGSLGDVQWSGLANTTFFIDPKEQLIAVAMSQYEGPDEGALVARLRDGVYGALTDRAAP